MAISKLENKPQWVEIASNSPTSGSTVSFTSLAAYRSYRVVGFDLTATGSTTIAVRFNNDSGTNYAYTNSRDGAGDFSRIDVTNGASAGDNTFDLIVDEAQGAAKEITFWGVGSNSMHSGKGFWDSSAAINQIDVVLINGFSYTFTTGTIKVYGRN